MTDYLPGYDAWKTTNPADEFLGPEPEDEDELPPEPVIEELWDGGRGEYVHEVTFASGNTFQIVRATAGAMIGDYEIRGAKGCIGDGFLDPDEAITYLTDPERRDW